MPASVSSLAGSPEAAAARQAPAGRPLSRPAARDPRRRGAAWVAVAVALVLAATAFLADGGLRLERTTYVEIALMLIGAGLCAAALLVPRARAQRLYGWPVLLGMALLAAYTAISIA